MKSLFFHSPFIFEDFDNLFNRTYKNDLDLEEDKEEYRLSVDLPGIKKEELKLEVKGNYLLINGSSKEKNRSYTKHFSLPEKADFEHIEADLKDGILTVNIKKKEERAKLIQLRS